MQDQIVTASFLDELEKIALFGWGKKEKAEKKALKDHNASAALLNQPHNIDALNKRLSGKAQTLFSKNLNELDDAEWQQAYRASMSGFRPTEKTAESRRKMKRRHELELTEKRDEKYMKHHKATKALGAAITAGAGAHSLYAMGGAKDTIVKAFKDTKNPPTEAKTTALSTRVTKQPRFTAKQLKRGGIGGLAGLAWYANSVRKLKKRRAEHAKLRAKK